MEKKGFFAGLGLLLLGVTLGLVSCGDDDEQEETSGNTEYVSGTDGVVFTGAATDVTASSATLTATVNQDLLTNGSVECFGVSYGLDEEADSWTKTTNTITGTTFTITLSSLSAVTTYYYKAFVKDDNGNCIYGSTRKFTTEVLILTSGDAIDLGLPSGTKWASRNVGASSPEGYGGYYAWGETEEKSDYDWDTYAYYDSSSDEYINIGSDIAGTSYDVAHVKWGGSWHMPTKTQIAELVSECTWTWTAQNGVNGQLVTGSNGNSIFLPAAGFRYGTSLYNAGSGGYYWGSTADESGSYHAYDLDFGSGDDYWDGGCRYTGQSVRPVSE